MPLFDLANKVPGDRTAFACGNETFAFADFARLRAENSETLEQLSGQRIMLGGGQLEIARLLPLLDGHVRTILLLASDIKGDLRDAFSAELSVGFDVGLNGDEIEITPVGEPAGGPGTAEPIKTEWILPTSGTTGTPKLVAHGLDSLTHSTKINIQAGGKYVWALTYDLCRYAGLQVYLQALLAGSKLVIPGVGLPLPEIVNCWLDQGCNAISGTPSMWRKILMTGDSDRLDLKRVTLGGEIADQALLDALAARFSAAKVVHIYASTEAGVGFSVFDGKEGFPASYLEDGVAGARLRIDEAGNLHLMPTRKSQRYIGAEVMFDDKGFIDTGDLVRLEGDRVLFMGRASGAINVGGNKVIPEEVEAVVLSSGLVAEVLVYGKKSPITGSIVCAHAVPIDPELDPKEVRAGILSFCKSHIEPFKVPVLVNIAKELPVNSSGKLCRSQNQGVS